MKKFFPILAAVLALPFVAVSCSDDDGNLPNVDYNISLDGGAVLDQDNGTIYVVRGDTLGIASLSVTNVDSDKAAAITSAEYFWDYNFIGASAFAPYSFDICIGDSTAVGEHLLTIRTGVIAVDKEPAIGIVNYPVMVVADSTQMPTTSVATKVTSRAGLKTN